MAAMDTRADSTGVCTWFSVKRGKLLSMWRFQLKVAISVISNNFAHAGYGFVKLDSAEAEDDEVFVHQEDIQMDGFRKLARGQRCNLDLQHDEQGRRKAANVLPHSD